MTENNSEKMIKKEQLFAQTLEKVKRQAREQGNVISEEDVRSAFLGQNFSEEQMAMVFDYLRTHKIGIGEPVLTEDDLDEEDINFLDLYLQDLKEIKEFSSGEQEAIILSAMAGEIDAKQSLIQMYLPQVVDVARLYTGQGVPIEDLIGEGNVAIAMAVEMLSAFETPDEVKGMLAKRMMDAMEDYIGENAESGQHGKKIADQVNKVADAARELADSLLRNVTVEELSAESGISEATIRDAIRVSAGKIYGIEDPFDEKAK